MAIAYFSVINKCQFLVRCDTKTLPVECNIRWPSQNFSISLLGILERPKKVDQTLTRVQGQIRIKYAKLLNLPPSQYSGMIASEQSYLNDDFKKKAKKVCKSYCRPMLLMLACVYLFLFPWEAINAEVEQSDHHQEKELQCSLVNCLRWSAVKREEKSSLFDLFSAFKGWNRRKFERVWNHLPL